MTPEQVMALAFQSELEKISGIQRVNRLWSSYVKSPPRDLQLWRGPYRPSLDRSLGKLQRRILKDQEPGTWGARKAMAAYLLRSGVNPLNPFVHYRHIARAASRKNKPWYTRLFRAMGG